MENLRYALLIYTMSTDKKPRPDQKKIEGSPTLEPMPDRLSNSCMQRTRRLHRLLNATNDFDRFPTALLGETSTIFDRPESFNDRPQTRTQPLAPSSW